MKNFSIALSFLVLVLGSALSASAADRLCFESKDEAAAALGFPAKICIDQLVAVSSHFGDDSIKVVGTPYNDTFNATFFRVSPEKVAVWFDAYRNEQTDGGCGDGSTDTVSFELNQIQGALDLKSLKITAVHETVTDWCHHLGRETATYDYSLVATPATATIGN